MGKRYKNFSKKINKRKVIKFILFLLITIGLIVAANKYYDEMFEVKETDSQPTVEEQLQEKDKAIEELTTKMNELTNKQEELINKQTELENKDKELEETIEKVRVSKANKKTAVTSRSGSTIRSTTTVAVSAQPTTEKWIWANVSAYCSCAKCCGKATGITASGTKATAGRTIAAPSTYSFGTKIELEGMGTYTVEDRGGAIQGNKIDVYFNSHSEALKFGRRQVKMRVVQ